FSNAEGSTNISQSSLAAAEKAYSINRKRATEQEWNSVFPSISELIESISKREEVFDVMDLISEEFVHDLIESFWAKESIQCDELYNPLCLLVENYNERHCLTAVSEVLHRLNICGVVGLKLSEQDSFQWYSKTLRSVEPAQISEMCKVRVHPMFFSSLGIRLRGR
ncbi:MAG: hypothetical protein AAGF90_19060, partial [Pseudomonadota bacterium]